MPNESGFWHNVVRPALCKHGEVERVENVVATGFPDVVYCLRWVTGFLELKDSDGWPARASTAVEVDHYTEQQRGWHRKWHAAGARVWLAARVQGHPVLYADDLTIKAPRVPDEFFLFQAAVAADVVGVGTRADWYAVAAWHGKTFDAKRVVALLTQ